MFAEILFSLSIASTQPDLSEQYTDSTKNYRISYPAIWTLNKGKESISFTAPLDPVIKDEFQEVLFVHVQKQDSNVRTLEAYEQKSLKDIRSVMGDTALIEIRSINILGRPGKEFLYEMLYKNTVIKIKQRFFKHDQVFYLLTFTSTPAEYEQNRAIADEMMQSFSLLE